MMRRHYDLNLPVEHRKIVIGNFDGVHLGHQRLLSVFENPSVITFFPHPRMILTGKKVDLICTLEERIQNLEKRNVFETIVLSFSREFSEQDPTSFLNTLYKIGMKSLAVGENFCFGKNRSGNVAMIQDWCTLNRVEFKAVEIQEEISSSKIRSWIESGAVNQAKNSLGYFFRIRTLVEKGNLIGRSLDAPTLNSKYPDGIVKLKPGVYATKIELRGQIFFGVTNVGFRPTVEVRDSLIVESHLLNVQVDAYGESISTEFIDFLRGEKKFDSISELKAQIEKDKIMALKILNSK